MKKLKIRPSPYIPNGEVWCSYDAFEHIKKILKTPDEVKIPIEKEDVSSELATLWHTHGSKMRPGRLFPLDLYKDGIERLDRNSFFKTADIPALFNFLKSFQDPLLSERFVYPWEWTTPWRREDPKWTFLNEAFASMNSKLRKRE